MRGASEVRSEYLDLNHDDYASHSTPRQIRHVSSVQVRNLTPFPVRDAFASALKQPSEQPQFTAHGHFSDDLDVAFGKKRARKISAASVTTLNGLRHDGEAEGVNEKGARKRTSSKASTSSGPGTTTSPTASLGRRPSISLGAPTVRPNRPRTISLASSHHSRASLLSPGSSGEPGTSMSAMFPGLLRDTSQSGLEKVLHSRLVETFISVTLPHDPPPPSPAAVNGLRQVHGDRPNPSSSRSSTPTSRPSSRKEKIPSPTLKSDSLPKESSRRNTISASSSNSSSRSSAPSKRGPASPVSLHSDQSAARAKSASISHPSGKIVQPLSSPLAQKQRSVFPLSPTSPSLSSFPKKAEPSVPGGALPPSGPASPQNDDYVAPDYLSPIHRQSTNPYFEIDPGFEFAYGTDLSGTRMRLEVWGHVERGIGWSSNTDDVDMARTREINSKSSRDRNESKGKERQYERRPGAKGGDVAVQGGAKGKERQHEEGGGQPMEWKVLEGWDVDLGDLVPLPDELASHLSHLPSNTLLIKLSPPGRTFYLPSFPLRLHTSSSQSSPHASGYNSDPESEMRKVNVGETISSHRVMRSVSEKPVVPSDAIGLNEKESPKSKGKVRSAGWQDILKLSSLQACILDIEQSLSDIVRDNYHANMSTREVSEREAFVAELRTQTVAVTDGSDKLRQQIDARRTALRTRRGTLTLARELNDQVKHLLAEDEEVLTEEREHLSFIQNQLAPMRTALSPDLLFTILDVPLPIPPGATDPAPPLSLPTHKEVTEEAVATSLGYAAQVVQLLAAYLGKNLVYPVTCIGSRSLIKDGISAMVGPRMFVPAVFKGVDTYRFEYGVFLLNKDIEMLMSDRNLRALDMRHTLPNLKNLLLTLTVNEITPIPYVPRMFLHQQHN
ncbi:hypothetical protein B0H21DRAFT_736282 [Amylocystis lapponica]|nr:hypothetical protein B0H21DRAFT_736282 [Amylocystis lapponica]